MWTTVERVLWFRVGFGELRVGEGWDNSHIMLK